MEQMHEDPDETKSWERRKRESEAEETAQMDEDPDETDKWESKKTGGGGVSA